MKPFLDEHFLLQTETAKTLYHDYAKDQPIIDYHCHLPPDEIAADKNFDNMSQVWLAGDHYKWRAMRTNGVNEKFITGDASDAEKFQKWAETVPHTMRNPLYHWTHLELRRYFGIDTLLTGDSAKDIYEACNAKLATQDFSVQNLLTNMKVKLVGTTDDPVDSLEDHKAIAASDCDVVVVPSFRPDKAMGVDDADSFNAYLDSLGKAANIEIKSLSDYVAAIENRHEYFHSVGCRVSDHGLNHIFAADFTETAVEGHFNKIRGGNGLSDAAANEFKSWALVLFAHLDHAKGWTQQFHLGAIRNNNKRLLDKLGPDTGFDSMGDWLQAEPLSKFFNLLDSTDQLAKTIVYNLNPAYNDVLATMIGNFQDGTVAGKMQFGSGWWFLDQKQGMEAQMNSLSNMGLLSRFVGMLTDSRSFLSYPRHEYFRRILCNLLGNDVENGELPHDIPWLGEMVKNISFDNAKEYFGITLK